MPTFTVTQTVQAPVADVFAVFADVENAASRITEILRIEKLTPGPVGVGSRFKETRVMFKREATETFEVTAFEPGDNYELTATSCGAEFCTRFTFTPDGNGTRVDVTVQTRALSLYAKLFTPMAFLMKGMMRKCLIRDLEQLRTAVETKRTAA
jgi:carbon monoxide dehydrogenase subunit G